MTPETSTKKHIKIIISTSPTGLGHIRVMNALLEGLPKEIKPSIIGIQDNLTSFIYRIISTNATLRKCFEFIQNNPLAENLTSQIIRSFQIINLSNTIAEIKNILDSDDEISDIIYVSTHPMIGNKIQKIIDKQYFDIPSTHALIVTDDSPQRFWVLNSDYIITPSEKTKNKLQKLCTDCNFNPKIIVKPYPINPKYLKKLPPHVLYNKLEQIEPDNPQKLRICIPISGAAVQLDFYQVLIEQLLITIPHNNLNEFTFSIITKEGNFTRPF
ncbi:MAG: hypothetical protein M3P33_02395, partial [bacterium]|nr:hypothetical protein [bacterium]